MTNFTEEIKNEITRTTIDDECCKLAVLSAFIRTSGNVSSRDGRLGFKIKTENESTAEFICDMLENAFKLHLIASGVKFDVAGGRDKFVFECFGAEAERLLKRLGVVTGSGSEAMQCFTIDEGLIRNDCCKASFIKGAFLGGGSCTLPDEEVYSRTGYHLEIVFPEKATASDFCELLCDFEILAKLVVRKDSAVVYVKSKEVISDMLDVLSVARCLEKLNKIIEIKDRANNENRVTNCSVSNIDKTVTAAVNQVKAIETVAQTVGLKSLDRMLFDVAAARLADKDASMNELAQRLGITKSCINHRMRKIFDVAKTLE